MDLRGVLRRKGVYNCRKAGKKITDCFSEFLQTSANGTVPTWPLDSLKGLVNSEVSSINDISLGLQYLYQKNDVTKDENNMTDIKMEHKKTSNSRDTSSIANPVVTNESKLPFSMDDLPRVIGNISKMYQGEDKKYGGWNDSLDYKLDMYKDICDINQCPIDRRMDGLMLALREPALSQFRAHRHDVGMTFEGMINHFRQCYEGIDFKRSELQAWHTITYKLIKEQNQTKSPSECVVILVDALNAKRRSLDPSQRTDDAMHTRLTNACWGIPEFQSALSAPSSHLPTFINQLKMAVSNYQAIREDTSSSAYIAENYLENDNDTVDNPEVNYTNRRFKNNYRGREKLQGSYRRKEIHSNVSSNDDRKINGTGHNFFKFGNNCYVCGRENCRAWKHDKDQRINARKRWESRSNTYIIESLDAQDAECENDSTDLYIAEAFSEMNFDFEA